jgi:hypothetical protein
MGAPQRPEMDPVQNLGVPVIRNDPRQRGFTQPCPLWNGACTVYTSHAYPRSCAKYKCQVLRRLEDDDLSLPNALTIIEETLELIREIEALLSDPKTLSFRERLIAHKEELESKKMDLDGEFLQKTKILLARYEDLFGVDDFIDYEK